MTEIYCKCGTQTLGDTTCAECGEPLMVRWIPVTERLPEDNGVYITCATYPENENQVLVVGRIYHGGHWDMFMYPAIVTHWMPFPEPPTEAE